MRISDWSSDVCSSDLFRHQRGIVSERLRTLARQELLQDEGLDGGLDRVVFHFASRVCVLVRVRLAADCRWSWCRQAERLRPCLHGLVYATRDNLVRPGIRRSEEHTSELQSLMRI